MLVLRVFTWLGVPVAAIAVAVTASTARTATTATRRLFRKRDFTQTPLRIGFSARCYGSSADVDSSKTTEKRSIVRRHLDPAEQPVLLVIRPGGEVERVRRARPAAVPEADAPETVDRDLAVLAF